MSAINILKHDTVVVLAEQSQFLIYRVVSVGIAMFTVSFIGKENRVFTGLFLPSGGKLEYLFLRLELRYASL